MGSGFRACVASATVAVAMVLMASMVSFAPAAAAASSCPSVDQQTGTVTPPAAPGVDWSGCDLDHADLAGADLANADLSGAGLSGADLYDATLGSADLSSADLTNANLTSAWLQKTDLDQADLAGATLHSVYSWHVAGTPAAIPAGWRLIDGYLVGPTADLDSADLRGADLSGMDLAGANLSDGLLSATDLPVSPRSFTAVFKLVASRRKSAPLTEAIAHAIAAAHEVRVTLSGNGIKAVAGLCGWDAAHGVFRCRVALPRHLPTGRSHPYRLTAQEEPGSTFIAAPKLKLRTANPATIYFR